MTGAICLLEKDKASVIQIGRDGNPAFAGAMLYSKYQTEEKVRSLMELGDLIELHEIISPTRYSDHYIEKRKGKAKKACLQPNVCVFADRDVFDENEKNHEAREYTPNVKLVYICEGVDFLYVFNVKSGKWSTYAIDAFFEGEFRQLKIDYPFYVKNLLDRNDITVLSSIERTRLENFMK